MSSRRDNPGRGRGFPPGRGGGDDDFYDEDDFLEEDDDFDAGPGRKAGRGAPPPVGRRAGGPSSGRGYDDFEDEDEEEEEDLPPLRGGLPGGRPGAGPRPGGGLPGAPGSGQRPGGLPGAPGSRPGGGSPGGTGGRPGSGLPGAPGRGGPPVGRPAGGPAQGRSFDEDEEDEDEVPPRGGLPGSRPGGPGRPGVGSPGRPGQGSPSRPGGGLPGAPGGRPGAPPPGRGGPPGAQGRGGPAPAGRPAGGPGRRDEEDEVQPKSGGLLGGVRSRLPFGGGRADDEDEEEKSTPSGSRPGGGLASRPGGSGAPAGRPGGPGGQGPQSGRPGTGSGPAGSRPGSPARPGASSPGRPGGPPGGPGARPGGSQPSAPGRGPTSVGTGGRPGGAPADEPGAGGGFLGGIRSRLPFGGGKTEEEDTGKPSAPGRGPTSVGTGGRPGGAPADEPGAGGGFLGGIRSRLPFGGGKTEEEEEDTGRPGAKPGAPGPAGRPGAGPTPSGRPGAAGPSGSSGGPGKPGGLPGGIPPRPGSGSPARPGGGGASQSKPGGLPGGVGSKPGTQSPSRPGGPPGGPAGGKPGSQPSKPGGLPGGVGPGRPGTQSPSRPGGGQSPSKPGGAKSPSKPGGLPGGIGTSATTSRPGGASPSRPGGAATVAKSPSKPAGLPGGIGRPGAGTAAGSPTKAPRARGKAKPAQQGDTFLTLDTKLDIIGVVLIIVSLITLLSFLSKEPGSITYAWLNLIRSLFGYGGYLVPIPIAAVGIWLIWRHFGSQLPPIDPVRIGGAALIFIGALVLTHAALVAFEPTGAAWVNPSLADPATPGYDPDAIWRESVPLCDGKRPYNEEYQTLGWIQQQVYLSSYQMARCGWGGGYVGAFIQVEVAKLIGPPVVWVLAILALIGGLMMATRTTFPEALEYTRRGAVWANDHRPAVRVPIALKRNAKGDLVAADEQEEKQGVAAPSRVSLSTGSGDQQKPGQPAPAAAPVGAAAPVAAAAGPAPAPSAPPPSAPALPGRPSIVTGQGPGGSAPSAPPASPAPATGSAQAVTPVTGGAPSPAAPAAQPPESKEPATASVGAPAAPSPAGAPPRPGAPPASLPSRPGPEPVKSDEGKKPEGPEETRKLPGGPVGARPGLPPAPAGTGISRPGLPPTPAKPVDDEDEDEEEDEDELEETPTGRPGMPPGQSGPRLGMPAAGHLGPKPSSPAHTADVDEEDDEGEEEEPDEKPQAASPTRLGDTPAGTTPAPGLPGQPARPGAPPTGGPTPAGSRPSGGVPSFTPSRPGSPPPQRSTPGAGESSPTEAEGRPGAAGTTPSPGAPPSGGQPPRPGIGSPPGSAAAGSTPPGQTPRPGMPPRPGGPPAPGTSSGGAPAGSGPTRPGADRTFGPPPPPSFGGPRPAPGPGMPGKLADEADEDDEIEFDDLATAPDPLAEAIDLEEDDEDVDEIIEKLVTDDDEDEDAEEDEDEDDDDPLPPSNGPQSSGRPAGSPNSAPGGNPGLPARPPSGGNPSGAGPSSTNPGVSASSSGTVMPAASAPAAAPPGLRPPVPTPASVPAPRPDVSSAAPKPPTGFNPSAAAVAGAPAPGTSAPPKVDSGSTNKEKPEWKLPSVDEMLTATPAKPMSDEELRRRAEVIEQTLSSFGAPGRVVEVNQGPVITQFGVEPDYIDGRAGKRIKVKVGKISALSDDLALSLAAPSIRIEAPVPGKGFVGIEVPNAEPSVVNLRSVMDTPEFQKLNGSIKLALGQDVSGQPVVADLSAMPHLLIAGTTGSGKSVCVNGIICTMLMTHTPETLKMIMVDPKRVELTNYNGIPHLMAPVVTELERIVGVLKWVQREMDERYRSFAMAGARNIQDFNERIDRGQIKDGKKLPFLIVVVDELADLMMLAPDETERVITRLAQMARATGIHIILSTQRPSVDVVTGLIKANFPARIAFAVATGVDSRVILDSPGAEKLLGRGDMLFQSPDSPMPLRMQGVYLSDKEIQKIVDYWRDQASRTGYTGGQALLTFAGPGLGSPAGPRQSAEPFSPRPASPKPMFDDDGVDADGDGVDDLFDEAVELVRDMEKASISLLQRHLRIGYTRAARLIDLMEERGVIGPHEGGSKPRTVLGPDGKPLSEVSDEDEDDDLL